MDNKIINSGEAQLFGIFDQLEIGLIVVGQEKNILFENELAASILLNGSVITECAGMLSAANKRDTEKIDLMLSGAIDGLSDTEAFIFGNSPNTELSITINSLPASLRKRIGAGALAYLVPLGTSLARDRSEALQSMYQLTRTEAQIASLLATGASTRNVGDRLNLTYETTRSAIKQIFQKTGTKRQAALVALINTAVPAVSPRQKQLGD